MSIKVSIVVPVYKTEPYLRQCLDSLINQKLRDIEIICVDDGSPDKAGNILDEYAKKDQRIKVVHQENKGLGSAYNAGQRIAKGEYIGFLDSDDWVDERCYYDLYQAAKKTGADVIKAGAYWVEQPSKKTITIRIPIQKCNRVITNALEVPEFVAGHVSQWSGIYKRSFLKTNNIHSPEGGKLFTPDISFIYQVWILMKSLYVVPNAYVHYRQHPNAATHQGSRMSFRLLNAHKEASQKMEELPLKKEHWYVKTHVEYEHFLNDWQYRCFTKRYTFISSVAACFRNNIKLKHTSAEFFKESEWNTYQFIAYMPILFWLNDVSRFWVTKRKTSYRFFGLFKIKHFLDGKKYYFFGIPYWFERSYDIEFNQLKEMNVSLMNEVIQLKNKLERRIK